MSPALPPPRVRKCPPGCRVPGEAISKRLRHAGIGVTSDLYLHLTGKLDREIADAGAAYILGGRTI